MKKFVLALMFVVFSLVLAGYVRAGSCSFEASVANSFVKNGTEAIVHFSVTPSGCNGRCEGYIKFRVIWTSGDGKYTETSSSSTKWSSNDGSGTEAVGSVYMGRPLCKEDAPCTIKDVSIYDKSCYD